MPGQVIAKLEAGGEQIAEVVAAVRRSDAIPQALLEAREFADQAKADLGRLPACTLRDLLVDLAESTLARRI